MQQAAVGSCLAHHRCGGCWLKDVN